MANPFKRGNFRVLENHAWYVPGVADIFILIAWLIAGTLVGTLVTSVFTLAMGREAGTEYAMLIAYPLQFIPAMMYAAYKSRGYSYERQGFKLDSNNFAPLGALLCAILVVVGTIAASFSSDAVSALLPPMPEWLESVMQSLTGGELWVDFLCVSIMAPFFEEWLCRGMILRGLLNSRKTKPVWAIVISAAFFALIHLNPWQAIPAFILGCLFGYVYYKTGSLKLTMLMHFANNTVALIIGQIPEFAEADNWKDILGNSYWGWFVLALAVLAGVILAFRKIKPQSPQGNCDPVEPLVPAA